MTDFAPLVPPDPAPAPDAANTTAGRSAQTLGRRSGQRLLGVLLAGGTTLAAGWAGFVVVPLVPAIALFAAAVLTGAFFAWLERRRARAGKPRRITFWELGCDALLVSGLVALTGGLASPWVAWYVACAGRAALLRGPRAAGVVAGLGVGSYLAVLAALGQIHGFDSALAEGLLRMAVLGGATGIVLVGAGLLRQSRAAIAGLHEEAHRRIVELERARHDLESTSALLRDLALTDSLTGVRNRRYFRQFQSETSERRTRFGVIDRRSPAQLHAVGVLVLDLDRFHAVNERYGQEVGDGVLRHAARVVRDNLRAGDTLVRWGGDEFLALLSGADAAHTGEIAARVADALRLNPYAFGAGERLSLSCSVGWSHVDLHPFAHEPLEAAAGEAGSALSSAKQAGGGRVHPPSDKPRVRRAAGNVVPFPGDDSAEMVC
jgi:diguanylate cyclase (GGDEF)-like protein